MHIRFQKAAKITLVLVYFVIAAGAIVRMTGSGMGCPDWPKCFGYYIPPTSEETLQWQSNREFKKGQVIIKNEKLLVAMNDFTTATKFDETLWQAYQRHDYAKFNVWHTWIEYINRLLGALAGLATLILALWSYRFWQQEKAIPLLSWLVVFGMGFQAWLGATVVYSVLQPFKITLHMFMALAIVALLLIIVHKVGKKPIAKYYQKLLPLFVFSLALTLIQIFLGTQVRQFVDDQVVNVGYNAKDQWLDKPELQFYIHRSLSILVVLINVALFWTITKNQLGFQKIKWVLTLIGIEVLTGIAMYYFSFPFASQPLHLILATLIFGIQFYLLLEGIKSRISAKSS